ncbi:efflux RND transporter periplasmic adaptor subunit [Povalibacter sp.]|uniref:efflux RND transporter periplasmic adaptor subunit n=1 Tax=Povalibacter sp. TaxID=1962978 RepID=UPI002F427DA4
MLLKSRSRLIQIVAVAVLIAGIFALLAMRGQSVPGYRVEARALTQSIVATGRVISVSRAQVGSEVTGVVLERRVQEGDVVAPGDVLVVLRADDLAAQMRAAEAALARLRESTRPQSQVAQREAQARLDQAQREVERRRDLVARGLIAREVIEQAEQAAIVARAAAQTARLVAESLAAGGPEERALQEQLAAARAALAKTIIRSQVAGVVLTRNAEPGDLIQPGRVLFDIAREGDTEILVPFDEKNLSVLRVGQRANCIADAFPNDVFPAEITLIAPRVDPQRGTVDVRLKVQPVPEFLRQDMTVSVTVETAARERAIVVSNDALMDVAGEQAHVWVVRDGRARRVAVRLGLRSLTMSEAVEGLSAGDWVLAQGDLAVRDGDRVRVIDEPLPGPVAPPTVNSDD